jgi:glycine/serine hydroxymethyltransferase
MICDYLDLIKTEEKRNASFLHLTSNEAQMSETARMFLGSKLSERYYMGAGENGVIDLKPFTVLGFPGVSQLIEHAEKAAKDMLGASVINLSLLSGVHTMMCAILSTTLPGDTVMTVHHDDGGHFATTGIVKAIGRNHVYASYDLPHLKFDVQKIADDFKRTNAKAFYMDVSYYINPHNLKEIRDALGKEAIIIYDASHTIGLIMGQTFQSPLQEGADIICANTHKTLPGPQKGMIAFKDSVLGEKANAIIKNSLYSSPHLHHLIALSTTILEIKEFGKEYALQVIANSNALGKAFENLGFPVRKANTGRYSENHQTHVFIEHLGDYVKLYKKLLDNNISTNFDRLLGPNLFIRLGTQEITRRGMKEKEMKLIASYINRAFKGEHIKEEVITFNKAFPDILYSFDQQMRARNK